MFKSEVPPTEVGDLEVPTSALPGEDEDAEGSTVLAEMYSVVSTYWIEPVTGQIVAGESTEDSTFDLDGEPVLTKAYTGTNGTQEGADDIAALAGTVTLLGTTAPLVLGVLGIVLIVIGLLLLRGGKDDEALLLATMTWFLPAARRRVHPLRCWETRTSPTTPSSIHSIDERAVRPKVRRPFAMLAWGNLPPQRVPWSPDLGIHANGGSMCPTNRPAINTS